MLCLLKFIILAFHIHFISTKKETFIATIHCIHTTCIYFFLVVLYREGKQFFYIVRNNV